MTARGWKELIRSSLITTGGFGIGTVCGLASGVTSSYFWPMQAGLWSFMIVMLLVAHLYLYRKPGQRI